MKKHKMILMSAVLLSVVLGAHAGSSKLILGEEAGLPRKCEVRGFDGETVRLSCSSGVTNLSVGVFSPPVLKEINGWAKDKAFKSSSEFLVTISQDVERRRHKKPKRVSRGDHYVTGSSEIVEYVIKLTNRSPVALEGMTVTCSMFLK